MVYASILLSYDPIEFKPESSSKIKESLKGKLTSAMKSAKSAIQNPSATMKNLAKYMTDNKDLIQNKFSGIAVAQMLTNGNISNKQAVEYLFNGFAPELDQTALQLGYNSAQQMKIAISNGSGNINVGSFITGFSGFTKSITDFKNQQKSKDTVKNKRVIEMDVTFAHNEQYQSETPDRRVQNGQTYTEFIHNLPETFSLDCIIQDGRRYSINEFKSIMTFIRDKKTPISLVLDEEQIDDIILQNFSPSRSDGNNGLVVTLEFKKVKIGMIETVPIIIIGIPKRQVDNSTDISGNIGKIGDIKLPNIVSPEIDTSAIEKIMKDKNRSWLKTIFKPKG